MRLWFSASVLADASNERSFPSSAPSIKRLLPLQSFTRGLILYKVKAPACSSAVASNTRCAFWGSSNICSLPFSSPHLFLLFTSFCSPFQVFPGVSVSPPFLLSSQDRWEQTGWQFSSLFNPLSCFLSVAVLPLSLPFHLSVSPN